MSTGCLIAAQDNLREALSRLDAFWKFLVIDELTTDVEKIAAASLQIYDDGLPRPADGTNQYSIEELQGYRPCAIIETAMENGFLLEADTSSTYRASGRLTLKLMESVGDADMLDGLPVAAAVRAFKIRVGALIDAMRDPSQLATSYFRAERIALESLYPGDPGNVDSEGGWQGCDISLEWAGI
jgi:hypothetical protein